ncbi:MAG TPA: hypothetical protein VK661_07215 [Planctomycetota bacterium]|nr:hypothetical protein [Planctomycetota bacterium]
MATLHVYAGSLDRLEAMLFARRPEKANYGPPEKLLEHLQNENVLERVRAGAGPSDSDDAEEALKRFVDGPSPEEPLDRTHALVLHGIVEVLCARIGDEGFGATTLAALADFGARFQESLGAPIGESLSTRRLPFVHFADDVVTPFFSYWMHDEMKGFLKRMPGALKAAGQDASAIQALHRLREQWTDAVGQGPDAILVGVV